MRLPLYSQYYNLVEQHPGLRMSEYSKLHGVSRSTFLRILPMLEYNGYLLSEINDRLYPFKTINRCPEELHGDDVSRWTIWRRNKNDEE